MRRRLLPLLCLGLIGVTAWLGRSRGERPVAPWVEVAPGVWRTEVAPYGHALVADGAALLIDAPQPVEGLLKASGAKRVEAVLLTHHHRDTIALADQFLADKVPVWAAKASAEWLTPDRVRKFWLDSLPLRGSRTAYFVRPVGLDGIDCTLDDGQTIDWRGWSVKVVASPGHSHDHTAFAASRGGAAPWLFAGDALAAPGKLWAPFTTDWDHWTDAGLTPAAKSLKKLAALKPRGVFPAHGEAILKDATAALERTADAVAEVAFLKSFERYSKERLGNAPSYNFLVKEQVATAGEKPFSRVSEHLFITGNTYVLTSKQTDGFLVMDPWTPRSLKQLESFRKDRRLGPLEVVLVSHAHFDHYDGVYDLPQRETWQIWTLDRVSEPLVDPFRLRAPFLDARPVKVDRTFKDGETAKWREYEFRFRFLPGQTEFTMGVETEID